MTVIVILTEIILFSSTNIFLAVIVSENHTAEEARYCTVVQQTLLTTIATALVLVTPNLLLPDAFVQFVSLVISRPSLITAQSLGMDMRSGVRARVRVRLSRPSVTTVAAAVEVVVFCWR